MANSSQHFSQFLSASKLLECSTLISYLKSLSKDVLTELYDHPATCLAVFRELPILAQQFVMRLLYVEQPVPKAVIISWVNAAYCGTQAQDASEELTNLGVWREGSMPGGMPAWKLDSTFRNNLKIVLVGGGEAWAMCPISEPDPNQRGIAFLDKYAQERWDTVLHFMVGSGNQIGVSADAVQILINAGLMATDPDGGSHSITRSGFQFLLMETSSQVWYFMLQYLATVEARHMSLVECLNFLFQLSFATLGKDYSTQGLRSGLLNFLQHLREFGLVYQRKRTAGRFYPTRLVLNIASGENKGLMERHREGYLVVETNYRVYAYTTSDLQVALIGLFAEALYRFPNMSVFVITRDSVRQAFRCGITSGQIIRFLRMHVHPQQLSKSRLSHHAVPPTVIDQIKLWEDERNRFKFTEGVLYNQFLSQADFELVRNYAENSGHLVWSNSRNRTVIVTKEGHDPVRKFWRQHSRN